MDEKARDKLFHEMVDHHGAALRRLCGAYERNPALKSELEQEILVNLWRSLPTFRREGSLRAWMYRVAHNTATRHVGRAVRDRQDLRDEARLDDEASPRPSPAEELEEATQRVRLHRAIEGLKPDERQLILLYLEDLPQSEIAEVTGLTVANVSTKIHRIKGELTRMIST